MSEPMKMRHISGETCENDCKPKGEWRGLFKEVIENHSHQGLYLKGLRLREGYTQKELGKLIGVNQNNISAMEHGKRPIGKAMAKKLSEVLKTDYRKFL
jgi:DNA-binding XRE family transcriptional regulator